MKKVTVWTALITFFGLALTFFLVFGLKKSPDISNEALCQDCNVILISITNLRYDHLSSNGYFRKTTPNLDKLAKNSLVFDNAFAHSSWTLPEAISIYTSLYPYQHGMINRYDGSKLSEKTITLIDLLNQAGYRTAAFTGGFDYHPQFGLTNRFAEYQECTKETNSNSTQKIEPQILGPSQYGQFGCSLPKAIFWLKENSPQKFFLHLQGYDAHCPFSQKGGKTYDPNYKGNVDFSSCLWTFDRTKPLIKDGKTYYSVFSEKSLGKDSILLGKEDIEHLIALYDEGITFADLEIGNFLDQVKKLGLLDKTIIIITSEHGDLFGKYGRFMRGGPLRGTLYDDVLHIPLMIKVPKVSPKKIKGLVQHIDLMPTLLDFLDLKPTSYIEGKSLIPLIYQNKKINSFTFAGAQFNPDRNNPYFSKKTRVESLRSDDWKLIEETVFDEKTPSQTIELYDMVNDKEELLNLADSKQDVLKDLESKLSAWSEKMLK